MALSLKMSTTLKWPDPKHDDVMFIGNPIESNMPSHWLPKSIVKKIIEMRVSKDENNYKPSRMTWNIKTTLPNRNYKKKSLMFIIKSTSSFKKDITTQISVTSTTKHIGGITEDNTFRTPGFTQDITQNIEDLSTHATEVNLLYPTPVTESADLNSNTTLPLVSTSKTDYSSDSGTSSISSHTPIDSGTTKAMEMSQEITTSLLPTVQILDKSSNDLTMSLTSDLVTEASIEKSTIDRTDLTENQASDLSPKVTKVASESSLSSPAENTSTTTSTNLAADTSTLPLTIANLPSKPTLSSPSTISSESEMTESSLTKTLLTTTSPSETTISASSNTIINTAASKKESDGNPFY
ncbi:putative uncharacterized protein DDB_G0268590 [Bombyx mandarina]|uniref:Uncharacterized protein n=1 Tax=Bombyx mandarina TaxID=7092 RepID=A0A6J2JT06_BOMMA|nr:putative uncharacterized protein DDB_G0268590 [Bombyx mandarina]